MIMRDLFIVLVYQLYVNINMVNISKSDSVIAQSCILQVDINRDYLNLFQHQQFQNHDFMLIMLSVKYLLLHITI